MAHCLKENLPLPNIGRGRMSGANSVVHLGAAKKTGRGASFTKANNSSKRWPTIRQISRNTLVYNIYEFIVSVSINVKL